MMQLFVTFAVLLMAQMLGFIAKAVSGEAILAGSRYITAALYIATLASGLAWWGGV